MINGTMTRKVFKSKKYQLRIIVKKIKVIQVIMKKFYFFRNI